MEEGQQAIVKSTEYLFFKSIACARIITSEPTRCLIQSSCSHPAYKSVHRARLLDHFFEKSFKKISIVTNLIRATGVCSPFVSVFQAKLAVYSHHD